jgi:hypothetical protein
MATMKMLLRKRNDESKQALEGRDVDSKRKSQCP